MAGNTFKDTQPVRLNHYELGLSAGLTLIICILLLLNVYQARSQALEIARAQARSIYQRDVIYRHWNAGYGAVYVPITDANLPNPYLANIPDRDIETSNGLKLTLINPAYMTRLVFDQAIRKFDVRGHITSLKPIRPENSPDAWETTALKVFESGKDEVSNVEIFNDARYMRLMRPLYTEQECLRCHAHQGYKLGEIRGGISIAVPMEPLWQISNKQIFTAVSSYGFIWLTGLIGIYGGAGRLRKSFHERDIAEDRIVALNKDLLARTEDLEVANKELEAFCSAISHDLRTPLAIIGGYCQVMQEIPGKQHGEQCKPFAQIIHDQTVRMDEMIGTLLNFSRLTSRELSLEYFDISALTEEVLLELRQKNPRRPVEFICIERLTVCGDTSLMRIVMQNLLDNALKYSSNKEKSIIEFGRKSVDGDMAYFLSDNGVGFCTTQVDRIFETFHRLHENDEFEGCGIGLATVQRIIHRHGGKVWAEGDVGVGATFYFTL
jgi:signal transduction histidine kinase